MKKSLLGHLFLHIKGSHEDVATMSLQYILNSYDILREEYNLLLSERFQAPFDTATSYECQSVGDDNERPDMSGTDSNGKEVVLCEMKFYAGLTSNQPMKYLERLKEKKGAGLAVVCPKDRMISLWETLIRKCDGHQITQLSQYSCKVDGISMALFSWEEVLAKLKLTATAREKSSLGDIDQLQGFYEQVVSNSFKPIKDEELGAYEAYKYERLMYVVDQVTSAICADKELNANTNNLRATPYRHGYKRFMVAHNHCVGLRVDLEAWADDRFVDTPIWVGIFDNKWKTPPSYFDVVSDIHPSRKRMIAADLLYLAIDVPCNVTEEEVVAGIKSQIVAYLYRFDSVSDPSARTTDTAKCDTENV